MKKLQAVCSYYCYIKLEALSCQTLASVLILPDTLLPAVCTWIPAVIILRWYRRRRVLRQSAPGRGSASLAEASGRQAGSASLQPSARFMQQSAKPNGGKPVSRLARASESPASSEEGSDASGSSEGEEDGEKGSSEEEEEEEEGSSEEWEQATSSNRQQLAVESPGRQLSCQQDGDSNEYADDSSELQAQDRLSPEVEAASLQQQQQQVAVSSAVSAAFTRADSSGKLMQQHMEHMHVAVRSRPVPAGTSASCWLVDPKAATITLNGMATAAKRKQALYSSNATRSSNSNGLDSGQSRAMLGTAPSTPGIGFWDSNVPMGTSMGYKFDQVLDESAETAAVYSKCIQSLVHSALEGVNGTVLAYGELTISWVAPNKCIPTFKGPTTILYIAMEQCVSSYPNWERFSYLGYICSIQVGMSLSIQHCYI